MGQNTGILAVALVSLWLAGNSYAAVGERIGTALCLGGGEGRISLSHTSGGGRSDGYAAA